MKLKLGAQRGVSPPSEVAMETQMECSSSTVSKCFRDGLSSHFAEEDCNSHTVLKSSQLVSTHEDITMTDTDSSSVSMSPSSSDCQSTGSLKQHRSKNVSVLYLFSKYRSTGQAKSSSEGEIMMMENDGSSVSISHSSSDCQSMKSTEEQLEQDCVCSFPVCQI